MYYGNTGKEIPSLGYIYVKKGVSNRILPLRPIENEN
tara:strand:+ start:294 stop:404 length:111 start_codon:yes stop_codon:yes gene_type:complete